MGVLQLANRCMGLDAPGGSRGRMMRVEGQVQRQKRWQPTNRSVHINPKAWLLLVETAVWWREASGGRVVGVISTTQKPHRGGAERRCAGVALDHRAQSRATVS